MTEHRDPYDSGAAPAPAATCPVCGTACTVTRKSVTLAPPDSDVAVYLVDAYELVYEPLPTLDPLTTLDDPELLEILADIEHERWSGWMEYAEGREDMIHTSGEVYRDRWNRQSITPYAKLTEAEKESDRIEARKGLAAIRAYLAAIPAPDPAPLTALERAVCESAVQNYDKLTEDSRDVLIFAIRALNAARAAVGREVT